MKNRQIILHDGSRMTLNDDEWRSVVNCKVFDDERTEIIRITRHESGLMTRVYAMRAAGGKAEAERNEIVFGGIKAAIQRAIETCGLGTEIAEQALAGL
jgi:hypothetical protein